jgi:hypothetical protein
MSTGQEIVAAANAVFGQAWNQRLRAFAEERLRAAAQALVGTSIELGPFELLEVESLDEATINLHEPPGWTAADRDHVGMRFPGHGDWSLRLEYAVDIGPLRHEITVDVTVHFQIDLRFGPAVDGLPRIASADLSPALELDVDLDSAGGLLGPLEELLERVLLADVLLGLPIPLLMVLPEAIGMNELRGELAKLVGAPWIFGEPGPRYVHPRADADLEGAARYLSGKIQRHHLPFGSITNASFATPYFGSWRESIAAGFDPGDARANGKLADSAIWTGCYVAAEAHRFAAGVDRGEALANLRRALDGLDQLSVMKGVPGLINRVLRPADHLPPDTPPEELHRIFGLDDDLYLGRWQGRVWLMSDHLTRDQYIGVLFGCVAAYRLVPDAGVLAVARQVIVRMLDYLLDNAWTIWRIHPYWLDEHGGFSATLAHHFLQQLAWLSAGLLVTAGHDPDRHARYAAAHAERKPLAGLTWLFAVTDLLDDPVDGYYRFNLGHLTYWVLFEAEQDPAVRSGLREGYEILRAGIRHHDNPFFDLVAHAVTGERPPPGAVRRQLTDWLDRPRRYLPDEVLAPESIILDELSTRSGEKRLAPRHALGPKWKRWRDYSQWQQSPFLLGSWVDELPDTLEDLERRPSRRVEPRAPAGLRPRDDGASSGPSLADVLAPPVALPRVLSALEDHGIRIDPNGREGDPSTEAPGLDYPLAYWMARVHGLVDRNAHPMDPPSGLVPDHELYGPETREVQLTWRPSADAESYALRVLDLDDPGASANDPHTQDPLYTLALDGLHQTRVGMRIREGHRYSWWVHAVNAEGWTRASLARFAVEVSTADDADYVDSLFGGFTHTKLRPGTRWRLRFEMKNTGESQWSRRGGHKLGAVGDQNGDAHLFLAGAGKDPNRVWLPEDVVVKPGMRYSFEFDVVVPSEPGTYTPIFRMVRDAQPGYRGHWFGEQSPVEEIHVDPSVPLVDYAYCMTHDIPTVMDPGARAGVCLKIINTGNTTWTRAEGYKLGALGEAGGDAHGFLAGAGGDPNRVWLGEQDEIIPGAIHEFHFDIVAPAQAGDYELRFQMVRDAPPPDDHWFGAPTPRIRVHVRELRDDAALMLLPDLPPSMAPGVRRRVRVAMKNTGDTTWDRAGGYKLGAVGDTGGDAHLFLRGAGGDAVRVWLPEGVRVAPGETYVFEFELVAPNERRIFTPCFRMVREGVRWFGNSACDTVFVGPERDDAVIVGAIDLPPNMRPGERRTVRVALRNTGTTSWTREGLYKLGAVHDATGDAHAFLRNAGGDSVRVWLAEGETIDPGQTEVFRFDVVAPSEQRSYRPCFRMVREGVRWFGRPSCDEVVVGEVVERDEAALVTAIDFPTTMHPGERRMVSATFRNTGTTSWTRAARYKLGAVGDAGGHAHAFLVGTGGDPSRVWLDEDESIAPQQIKRFRFEVVAPTDAGLYRPCFRMVREGVRWFGPLTHGDVWVRSGVAHDDAELVEGPELPTRMSPGQRCTVRVVLKNTGSSTWTRAALYKLGAVGDAAGDAHAFLARAGGDPNRVWLDEDEAIHPGETKIFSFDVVAPDQPRTYEPCFRMVCEDVGWFGERTYTTVIV